MRGFTIVETLVAVSLLTIAIVVPMSLASQSLSVSYYARDQMIAFHLAQEAFETIREQRDTNILSIARGVGNPDLLGGIPATDDSPFIVDALTDVMTPCGATCPALQTNGSLYGYNSGWTDTNFTRTVRAHYVGSGTNEVKVTVTVSWHTGAFQTRTVTISESFFRWVEDGSAAT